MGFLIYLLIGLLVLIYEVIASFIARGKIETTDDMMIGWFEKHPRIYIAFVDILVILLWPVEVIGRLTCLIIIIYHKLRSK